MTDTTTALGGNLINFGGTANNIAVLPSIASDFPIDYSSLVILTGGLLNFGGATDCGVALGGGGGGTTTQALLVRCSIQ